eukprot:958720-Pyramimonas_sp.AAC.1
MLYRTELFDVFRFVQCENAAPILCAPPSASCTCTCVESALAKTVLDALRALVNGVLGAGHMNIINMLGCEQ